VAALTLSVEQARAKLLRAHPELQGVCDAFSWLLHFTPAEAAEAVGWLGSHSMELVGLLRAYGPTRVSTLAVTLWGMAHAEGPARVAKLLHYLADPASHTVPVDGVEIFLEQLADRLLRENGPWSYWAPKPPTHTVAPEVLEFVEWVAGQPARVRRDCLDLFNLLLDEELTGPWQAFWRTVERAV